MAVLDKNKVIQKTTDAQDEVKKSEGVTVDLLQDKTLPTGEKRKHDVSEDAWARSAPPKAARFSLKLHLAKDPVTMYKDDEGKRPPIYNIAIEAKIVNSKDGEYDNVTVFPRVSTAVGRGKNISTAAGLLAKLGYSKNLENEIDDKSLGVLVVKALQKEPILDAEVDWQAYSKEDKRVVYRGMHKFPQDADGEPMYVVDYMTKAKVMEEINASLEVVHWYGKGEESKPKANAAGASGGGGGKGVQPLQLAGDEETTTTSGAGTGGGGGSTDIEQELAELAE